MAKFCECMRWSGPLLNGDNYQCWKVRFQVLAQALDPDLWSIISKGEVILGLDFTVYEYDRESVQKNAMALHLLYNLMDDDVFKKIYNCKTPKEVWDRLKFMYGHFA